MIVESYFYGYTIGHIKTAASIAAALILLFVVAAQIIGTSATIVDLNTNKNYSVVSF